MVTVSKERSGQRLANLGAVSANRLQRHRRAAEPASVLGKQASRLAMSDRVNIGHFLHFCARRLPETRFSFTQRRRSTVRPGLRPAASGHRAKLTTEDAS